MLIKTSIKPWISFEKGSQSDSIKFNENAWLKPYIHMNTKLRPKAKNNFTKYFLKLMVNVVFEKNMKNVRNHSDIKLVTT